MLETFLKRKPFVTNIYGKVLDKEPELFNFKQVDECDLPRNSKSLRVKKIKKAQSAETIKKQEVFEDPIEVPESEWVSRVLPSEISAFSQLQKGSNLKKSYAYFLLLEHDPHENRAK